jgi:ParB-like chromosome segregation protein Spo0J
MLNPKINPAFKDLIPPLNESEFHQLEQNILAEGSLQNPIKTWRGYIVDGHNRYAICKKHAIPITTQALRFACEGEAKLWIAENQLGRRNLSDAARIEIAAKKVALSHKEGEPKNTRKSIARAANVSEQTVARYMKITGGGAPELVQKVRSGKLKIGTAYNQLQNKAYITEKTTRKIFNQATDGILNPDITNKALIQSLSRRQDLYDHITSGDFTLNEESDRAKLKKWVDRQVGVVGLLRVSQ